MFVYCPSGVVRTTLKHLRQAGYVGRECVVLWLGSRESGEIRVKSVYRPIQKAREDMFHIPPQGMTALLRELRRSGYMVAAQVHSHPGPAFHSRADDKWAIIRHEGALSLVVPNFAAMTTVDNFLDESKVYRFSCSGKWLHVKSSELNRSCLQIV